MRKVYRTIERGVALSQEINARGVTNVTLLSAVVDSNTGTTSPLTSAAFTLTSEGFRILVPSNLLTSDVTNIEIRYNSVAIVSLEVSLKAVEVSTGGAVASVVGRTGVVTGAHIASDVALTATYAQLAPDWVTGRAYVVGELVVSSGTLYRCTTAHTSSDSIALGNFAAIGASSAARERVILPLAATFGGGNVGTWLAANRYVSLRFTLDSPFVPAFARVPAGVASGNVQASIRSITKTATDTWLASTVCTSGVIAAPAVVGNAMRIPFATTPTLPAGEYVISFWADNATLTVIRTTNNFFAALGGALAAASTTNAGGIPSSETLIQPDAGFVGISVEGSVPSRLTAGLMGDSITSGQQWFTRSDYLSGWPFNILNKGQSGEQTGQMVTRFAADITANHPSIVNILAGTNNIGASSSPNSAAIISDLSTMVNAATGDGSRVILCTLLPRNATVGVPLSAAQIAALNAVNTWIRGRAAAGSVYVCDWTVQMSTGDGVTPTSALFSDDLHPNEAGALVMAPIHKFVLAQVAADLGFVA